MTTTSEEYDRSVFLNCPFDEQYHLLFDAILFTVSACGFRLRCALEIQDSAQARIEKIQKIIKECRLGIHDISRTTLDAISGLPRFNMPFELGLFLGAKYFGAPKQKRKACIVIDVDRFRYQKFLSDIAGQDPVAYDPTKIDALIGKIRDWLNSQPPQAAIPGPVRIRAEYQMFCGDRPQILLSLGLEEKDLSFTDRYQVINNWLTSRNPPA